MTPTPDDARAWPTRQGNGPHAVLSEGIAVIDCPAIREDVGVCC
jgi:hypothetical protein